MSNSLINDIIFIVGLIAAAAGLYAIWPPLSLVLVGTLLMTIAILRAKNGTD